LASPFRSNGRLEAENATLRQQLIVLQRKVGGRAEFTNGERLFFIQLYRWFHPQGHDNHLAGDAGALASRRFSPLLALEISQSAQATFTVFGHLRP
jgi:hypothetical protein